MEILLYIAIITFGILQVILFFKLWGMTDDIKEIKNKYLSEGNQNKNTIISTTSDSQNNDTLSSGKMSKSSIIAGIALVLIIVLAIILSLFI